MMKSTKLKIAAVVLAAGVLGGGAGVTEHKAVAAEKQADKDAKTAATHGIQAVTLLQTRQWSADGKVPTGTIWRGFQTWRTDVARTEKGQLLLVDPLTPRQWRSEKGEIVRQATGWTGKPATSKLEVCPAREAHGSAYPPANWQAPDFDDSTWIRDPYPQRELYSLVALRCLRGKFEVNDPQQTGDLSLTVRFRGGAVAYVNGKELGRAFLPKGEIKPETLAQDYPKEAYVTRDGVLIEQGNCQRSGADNDADKKYGLALKTELGLVIWGGNWNWHATSADNAYPGNFVSKDPQVVARYRSRCRTLQAKIPAAMLRKGVNVLAVEIHRAPAWEGMFTAPSYFDGRKSNINVNKPDAWWDRAVLEDLKLTAAPGTAVVPNVAPAKGFRVWNHPASLDLDASYYGDPNEPLLPVRLRGLKNGTYSGLLVAGSTGAIKGFRARVTDLRGRGGVVPASAVTVAYARLADGGQGNNLKGTGGWTMFDILDSTPPREILKTPWDSRTFPPMQPVWLTVRVPRDAKAGKYQGTVTVSAEGEQPVTTTLQMEVVGDWVLPEASAFKTYVGFLECPDAVAAQYKVAMWSEEHWKLLDKVFEVLGQVGTKDLFVTLVAKTHQGNPHAMVRWIKQADGSYKADTRIAERYIDTAIKHLGKIPVVCFFIAQRSQYCGPNNTASDQFLCTELDPQTGELKDFLPPKWGTPRALTFWKPLLDKLRDFLAARGMRESMMFGYIAQDMGPLPPGSTQGMPHYFADLREMAPNTRWMVTTHTNPVSWRMGALRNVDFLGGHSWMFATIHNARWMDENDTAIWKPKYGWRDKTVPFFMLAASRSRSPTWDNDHCSQVNRLRVAPEGVLLSQAGGYTWQGFGSWGADFWGNEWFAVAGGRGNMGATFANCGLSESTALWFVGPGETGPVPTSRTRMLQEGLQEAEARIFVQDALLDQEKKLGPGLAKRCKELCDERTRMLSYLANFRYNDGEGSMPRLRLIPDVAAWDDAAVELYRLADEVAQSLAR